MSELNLEGLRRASEDDLAEPIHVFAVVRVRGLEKLVVGAADGDGVRRVL